MQTAWLVIATCVILHRISPNSVPLLQKPDTFSQKPRPDCFLRLQRFTYRATKKPNPSYVPSCSRQGNGGKGKGEKGWGWNNWDSKGSDKGWDKGWGKGWGWGGRRREADGSGWMELLKLGNHRLFKLGQFCGVNYSNWMNKTWWFKAIYRHILYKYISIIFIYLVVYTRARIRSLGVFPASCSCYWRASLSNLFSPTFLCVCWTRVYPAGFTGFRLTKETC